MNSSSGQALLIVRCLSWSRVSQMGSSESNRVTRFAKNHACVVFLTFSQERHFIFWLSYFLRRTYFENGDKQQKNSFEDNLIYLKVFIKAKLAFPIAQAFCTCLSTRNCHYRVCHSKIKNVHSICLHNEGHVSCCTAVKFAEIQYLMRCCYKHAVVCHVERSVTFVHPTCLFQMSCSISIQGISPIKQRGGQFKSHLFVFTLHSVWIS